MKSYFKSPYFLPILSLFFISATITEVFTGSTPVEIFTNPIVFLLFATFGYGFPTLVIREIWIRNNLTVVGVYVLGIVYGLYNEWLFARSLIHPFRSPIESFALYGITEGVRVPSLLEITSYHAVYAIILPIIFVNFLFPKVSKVSWISKKKPWRVRIISVSFGTLAFLYNKMPVVYNTVGEKIPEVDQIMAQGQFGHYLTALVIATILTCLAFKLPRQNAAISKKTVSQKQLFLAGLGIFLFTFLIPVIFAVNLLPIPFLLLFYFVSYFLLFKAYIHFVSIPEIAGVQLALYAQTFIIILGILIAISAGTFFQLIFLLGSFLVAVFLILKVKKQMMVQS